MNFCSETSFWPRNFLDTTLTLINSTFSANFFVITRVFHMNAMKVISKFLDFISFAWCCQNLKSLRCILIFSSWNNLTLYLEPFELSVRNLVDFLARLDNLNREFRKTSINRPKCEMLQSVSQQGCDMFPGDMSPPTVTYMQQYDTWFVKWVMLF